MKGASLTALVLVFVLAVLGVSVTFTFLYPSKKLPGEISVDSSKTLKVPVVSAPKKARFLSVEDSLIFRLDSLSKISKPVMGYRFVITGDFNGDHIPDTLIERYTDSLGKKEVAKYDEVYDYFDIIYRANFNNYRSFMQSKSKSRITNLDGSLLGFHYIENCGDLNGDNKDELFFVCDDGSFSNITRGYFYTYADTGWTELNYVSIWKWMFPPTPSAAMLSSMMGYFEFGVTNNDSIDAVLEKKLKSFHYVTRKGKCAVEFECRSFLHDGEEDAGIDIDYDDFYKRRLKKITINKRLYLADQLYKALSYPVSQFSEIPPGNLSDYIVPVNDPASSLTVRVNTCSPESPFIINKDNSKKVILHD